MEQLMSTGGGWQDQVGGLTDGIKLASTKPGLLQEIQVEHLVMPKAAMEELQERFVLIYTGQRRLARNLLREVVGGYIGSNPNSIEVLYEIQRTAVLMKFELEKGNIDGFAELLESHWELSKRLDGGSTNTCIDQIFLSCQDLLSARMICGAGGGGFLQVDPLKGAVLPRQTLDILEFFLIQAGIGDKQNTFVNVPGIPKRALDIAFSHSPEAANLHTANRHFALS